MMWRIMISMQDRNHLWIKEISRGLTRQSSVSDYFGIDYVSVKYRLAKHCDITGNGDCY